jgi:photosystem II stability/assembly factor-like uncharacterized protein
MKRLCDSMITIVSVLAAAGTALAAEKNTAHWQHAGWGGGGQFCSAAFHPTRDGVIYMGSDCLGAYKTEDHGQHWRMINNGIVNYAVYSMAVDRQSPETVYAATMGGLSKSIDGGEHWKFMPKTGPKDLRITGEHGVGVRAIAVDPTRSNVVFAGNSQGKIYKSVDGGETWKQVYEVPAHSNAAGGTPVGPKPGGVCCVAVSPAEPDTILAGTQANGVLLSRDGGETWQPLATPKLANSVAAAATDPKVLFAACGTDGVWKSSDKGKTWVKASKGIKDGQSVREIVVSPSNAEDVYIIASFAIYAGFTYASHDGGATWTAPAQISNDPANPTYGPGFSNPLNVAVNPSNPRELFVAAGWRAWVSSDAGRTWNERDRGADITCFEDVHFQGKRVYACAMDEGAYVTEDEGATWRRLFPQKYDDKLTGHIWRLAISESRGKDRIVATGSPWIAKYPNYVAVSEDGGATFKITTSGLPDYRPTANTMWGNSFPRALAADPANPQVIYLGMDGDATAGKSGGGIFKSTDGGYNWKQLPHQPGSRRSFFGLAVDPTDSKRLYWAACGTAGGLWRSEDGGDSWQLVFGKNAWSFNVYVAADGTVYCPDMNLSRSTDHGKTWKQLTHFTNSQSVMAIETHPRDPNTLWISRITWGGDATGAVYKTTDGGATWQDITGDLPYRKPLCLRYNPQTGDLWAAGVGIYRIKQ